MVEIIHDIYTSINFFVVITIFMVILAEKKERRNPFGLRLAGSLLAGSVFSWLLSFAWRVDNPSTIVFIFSFLLSFFVGCVALAFCYRMTKNEVVFYGICGYAIQHLAYSVNTILTVLLSLCGVHLADMPVISMVVEILCDAVLFFLIYRILGKSLQDLALESREQSLALPLVIMLTAAVVLNAMSYPYQDARPRLIFSTYAAFVCITTLYAMFKVFRISALALERNTIHVLTQKQKEQYELQKKNMEYINIKCHDLRKQLDYLRGGEIAEEKLQEIKQQTRLYDSIAKTDNETLDIILTERSLYCEREGIRFTYIVDGKQLAGFDSVDICAIFCNLIDNAIEAVMKMEREERFISLKVSMVGNMLYIAIYNPSLDLPKVIDEDNIITSKGDKLNHGFGLKSVRMTVNNHGGEMKVYTEENTFHVTILIPVQ